MGRLRHGSHPRSLRILGLHSPHSAIVSAIIFSALIIVALVPLGLHGVAYRPAAAVSLRRNVLLDGVGGATLNVLRLNIALAGLRSP